MGVQNSVNLQASSKSSIAFISFSRHGTPNVNDKKKSNEKVTNNTAATKFQSSDKDYAKLRRRPSKDNSGLLGEEQDDPWGWFEDFGSPHHIHGSGVIDNDYVKQPMQRAMTLPAPATSPPVYVLESSLSYQRLWYETAGRRPRQPPNEREYFERLWERNFALSAVKYTPTNNTSDLEALRAKPEDDVLFRGKGPFSNAVSKSFANSELPSVTLQIPRFRVRRCENNEVHAEYLVVVSVGILTFGVWRRHSDFKTLASKVQIINETPGKENEFKNAMLSWQCLIHRQRWFRCLDKEYLALKSFLLERFMHDLLFESNSPDMISEFLGIR